MLIKVIPACKFLLPVISTGGVILREEYCILAKNHPGPHRGMSGSAIENTKWNLEQLERGR